MSRSFKCIIIIIILIIIYLTAPHGMWDSSSLTRDQTCAPCIGNVES